MESPETKNTKEILDEVCVRFEAKYNNPGAMSELRKSGEKISSRVEKEAKDFIEQILQKKADFTGKEVKLISGRSFPDITLFENQGIEIKTSQQKGWKIPGNSVQEGSRISEVEVIFILFFNYSGDFVECRYGLYEDYVTGFVVTHNPRYQIDMELAKGDSVFEKMGMTYSEFKSHEEPRRLVVDYYIKNSEPGEHPWFSRDPDFVSPPTIKKWSSLPRECKQKLLTEMYARFPEVLGSKQNKYHGAEIWLIKQHGILDPSMRDKFSAGEKVDLTISNQPYPGVPKKFSNLNDKMKDIIEFLHLDHRDRDSSSWSYSLDGGDSPIIAWKKEVKEHCPGEHRDFLEASINSHCT
jgi:hypothetical protein